jgi:hypothetical protein
MLSQISSFSIIHLLFCSSSSNRSGGSGGGGGSSSSSSGGSGINGSLSYSGYTGTSNAEAVCIYLPEGCHWFVEGVKLLKM